MSPDHVDELLDVMLTSRTWNLGKSFVHIVDGEADSFRQYHNWHRQGNRLVVPADEDRKVL